VDREFIFRHWYADMYERFENQTDDVEFLLEHLGEHAPGATLNILEAACGGGRLAVPLAKAGHSVTGFDADERMLLKCVNRSRGLANLRVYRADGVTTDWGSGYDLVVLGGNILINIRTDNDYEQAQRLFIGKAAKALRVGGHAWLDFDLYADPAAVFGGLRESSYFAGTDDLGNSGRSVSYGGVYNPVTRICAGTNHIELTLNTGERLVRPEVWRKHIPTREQVFGWLGEAGLAVERTYKNLTAAPLPNPLDEDCRRATIWARKI
jgi:SAM-dependent methyltransferase